MPQTHSVLQVTPLPVATLEYVDDLEKENKPSPSYDTIGGILFDTKYAWTSNGPRFTLFNSKTGAKVAAWAFGSVVRDSATKVVCVDELRRPTGKLPLLVIGLDCTLTGGMICIFDIAGSRVLRSIQLKDKVTSLHVIDASYDQCPLPGPLRAFDGILSVGTTDGSVLLLDICRQTCEEAVSGLGLSDIRDEINFCQVKTLFLGDIYSLELHKQVAIKNGEHLCIHLNATNSANEHFILKGPKGEDRVYVNKVEVVVSALHYCPQLGSLLVGYNFGAWQLWNLINLQLMYTSPVYEENVPVSHFAIQEPCDDPRACCYVWTVYSNINPYDTGFPVAVLYSLNYDTKEWHEGYGILYQDLTSCAVRFQTDLTLLGEEDSENKGVRQGAHCLRLQGINKSITKGSLHEHQEETLSLCSIIWSGWSSDSKTGPRTYMSLFDLNQWYKEQMPSSPRLEDYGTYMTRICLSDLLHSVNSEHAPFLDVRIDINTISQFFGSQRLEEHYHPVSLAFQLCALRECDVTLFNNQGSQRALLADLEAGGPLALIKPSDYFHLAISLGLSPLFADIPAKASPSIDYQRDFLLDIALEQQLLGWLCRCASAWSNGSYSAAGCTLHLLLTWGWQRAQVLKQNADKLITPLFDYSGLRLDANTHNLLSNCARQLKNLTTLFEFVVQRFTRFMVNSDAIKKQWESLQMVSIHLEVLQWLLNVGLLPECPLFSYPRADEFNRISAPYPVDRLIEYYNKRRTCLQTLNAEQFSTSGSLLFIDNLVDVECGGHKLQKEWQNDGGTGLYPPPSLQALLRTYLIENVDISFKHCVTVYVFLDLAMTLDQSRYKSTITHLIKFPAVFRLSPSIIKITQAFWQLDHGDFTTAMEQLLDPLVSTDNLKMWHHRVALKALLAQDQHNFALLYLQVRRPAVTEVQDLCTVLSLYVANSMLDEAFHFQRRNKSDGNEARLLRHFFRECDRRGEISSMLYLPLTLMEEEAFLKYLQDVKHPQLKDLQILYYVQNSRYMDAFEVNNALSAIKAENKGLQGQQNVEFRDFILNGLTDTLPKVSKSLMNACWNEKNKSWREVKRPEPFSVFVHNASEQVKYKSTVIQAGLLKAKEIWTHPVLNKSVRKSTLSGTSQEMPFVNTPTAKRLQPRTATPVIYSKITKLDLSQEDQAPSPAKRFKPSPRASITSPEMQRSLRVEAINSDITCTNLSIQLVTPLINRRTPKRSTLMQLPEEKFSVGTPQSILKIRNLVRNSESPDSAIDTSTSENVNAVSKGSKTLENSLNASANTLARKISLGLTPRKPLPRSSRPAVRFDISRTPSETSLASTPSESGFEVIQERALIHSPLEGVQKLSESGLGASSGSNSVSTEEVFYTPDASNSNVESKETSQVESDDSKILHQQVPNVIMTRKRKSLIDSESKPPTSRGTYKRPLEDISSTSTTHEIAEVASVDSPVKAGVSQTPPSSPKTPRARRSYKGSLPEGGVRSSPRIRRSLLPMDTEQPESKDKSLNLELRHTQKDSPQMQVMELEPRPLPEISPSPSKVESPIRTSLKGRRSLSRQVLESNTFSKISEPLSAQIKPNTSQLEISYSKTETSFKSKSVDGVTTESLKVTAEEQHKDVFTNSKDADTSRRSFKHTHEESSSVSKENLMEELDGDSSSLNGSDDPANLAYVLSTSGIGAAVEVSGDYNRRSLAVSEVDESVGDDPANVAYVASDFDESSEKVIADAVPLGSVLETTEEGVSDADLANMAYIASANTSSFDESSGKVSLDVVPPVETSVGRGAGPIAFEVRENQEATSESEGVNNEKLQEQTDYDNKMEIANIPEASLIDEPQNIAHIEDENLESATESDKVMKEVAVNVYDDLSGDNYASADPEMNVFEITVDLDLNQGMCATTNADILGIDSNYNTNEEDVFADKSDVLSNVIAVNEGSLEQFEVTENNELNKAMQEDPNSEAETVLLTEMDEQGSNVEIIELDSSSDASEPGPPYSEPSLNDSQSSSSYDERDSDEEQSHSNHSGVEVHSTTSQKVEILSDSESSQNADSTSDDYGRGTSSSTSYDDEDFQERLLDDIPEESSDAMTTSGQLDAIPEETVEDLNERVLPEVDTSEAVLESNQSDVIPEGSLNISEDGDLEPTSSQLNYAVESISTQQDVTEQEDNLLQTIPEQRLEVADSQQNITLSEPQTLVEGGLEFSERASQVMDDQSHITIEDSQMTRTVQGGTILVEDSLLPSQSQQSALEQTSENAIPKDSVGNGTKETTAGSSSEYSSAVEQATVVVVQQVAGTKTKRIEKDLLDETVFSKTPNPKIPSTSRYKDLLDDSTEACSSRSSRNIGWLNQTDILDATTFKFKQIDDSDLGPSSTPSTSTAARSVAEESKSGVLGHTVETESLKGKLPGEDNDPDFKESTLKSSTPARRSRRLSSLQATSTPEQLPVKRSTRRSASFSFSQKSLGVEEPSTSKETAAAPNAELVTSTRLRKRSNSTTESNMASVTLPAQRKRSLSTDIKHLPQTKRMGRSISTDIQEKLKEAEGGVPAVRTRRAASVTVDLSVNQTESKLGGNGETIDESKSKRRTKAGSSVSSKSGSRTKQKPKRSKSTIIVAATKSKLLEYSTARRLTRRQASLLERTLGSTHLTLEVAHLSDGAESDSESEEENRGPDIDEIDPINLLDKSDFKGEPDSDEEKAHQKSPSSSVPESPIGARLRNRSSLSNTSPKSDTSTVHSESGSLKKQKLRSAKRAIIDPNGSISSRTRQRSKSIDEAFTSAQTQDKGSPPKLRKTRRGSKDDNVSGISQARSLTGDQKVVTTRRRTRSTVDQPVSSPAWRERNPRLAKPELPKIIEEQSGSVESHTSSKATTKSGKKN